MNAVERIFRYKGLSGCESKCGLRLIPLQDGRTVVICSELLDNTGTSVTNFAENLVELVCAEHHIQADKLVWIEHYPAHRRHPKPDWDLVTFKAVGDGNRSAFWDPEWRPMSQSDWQDLGLTVPEEKSI